MINLIASGYAVNLIFFNSHLPPFFLFIIKKGDGLDKKDKELLKLIKAYLEIIGVLSVNEKVAL